MRILTQFTAMRVDHAREIPKGDSLTLPDQAVSPQELLRRFATGQPLGFKDASPIYDSDEFYDIPEFYKMDNLDRLHHMQENADNVIEKKATYDNAKEAYLQQKNMLEDSKKATEAKNAADENKRSAAEEAK